MDRVAALVQSGGKVNRNRLHGANRIGSAALVLGEARMDKRIFLRLYHYQYHDRDQNQHRNFVKPPVINVAMAVAIMLEIGE